MTGLVTNRKHVSTRCVQTLPGPIPRPLRSVFIRTIPKLVSAATLRRPRQASGHPSTLMKSDAETPPHPRCSQPTPGALAALNSPNETHTRTRARSTGPSRGDQMGKTLAAFAVATSLLTLASSEASAGVSFATGLASTGYAPRAHIIDAEL